MPFMIYMSMAIEFVGLMVTGLFLGHWADQKFQLGGIGLVSGVFLALISWSVHFVWFVKQNQTTRVQKPEDK